MHPTLSERTYFEVGLVDTGEGPCDDSGASVEPRLESGMLTRTTLAVVVIDNESPRLVARFEALCNIGDGIRLRFP